MVKKHEKPLYQVINGHQEFIAFSGPKININNNKIFY